MVDDDTTQAQWNQLDNESRRWVEEYTSALSTQSEVTKVDVSGFLTSNGALLKKEDIGQKRPIVTISGVDITEFDGEKKLVLKFAGKEKGMALNKTNLLIISEAFGHETDHWRGKKVELWVDPYVTFGGKVVGGLKVTPKDTPPPPPPPKGEDFDDEIPF